MCSYSLIRALTHALEVFVFSYRFSISSQGLYPLRSIPSRVHGPLWCGVCKKHVPQCHTNAGTHESPRRYPYRYPMHIYIHIITEGEEGNEKKAKDQNGQWPTQSRRSSSCLQFPDDPKTGTSHTNAMQHCTLE